MSSSKTSALFNEQLKLESHAVEEAIKAYRKKMTENKPLPPDFLLMKKVLPTFSRAIQEFQTSKSRTSGMGTRAELQKIDAWEIGFLTLNTVIQNQPAYNVPLQNLAEKIGKVLLDQVNYLKIRKHNKAYLEAVEKGLSSHTGHRRKVLQHVQKSFGLERERWSKKFKWDVGHKLISLLVESTGLFQIGNGHVKKKGDKPIRILQPHPATESWIEEAHKRAETMHPHDMPMVIPPRDWSLTSNGGYYTRDIDLITSSITDSKKKGFQTQVSEEMLHALNALQQTAWQINQEVLEVALELSERDFKLGVLASPAEVVFPIKPAEGDEFEQWKQENPEAFEQWKRAKHLAHEEEESVKSKTMSQAQVINMAKRFSKYKAIYFPWQIDFRGRAYACSSSISPQGADLSKGLLRFSKGKALGKDGHYWLAIHGANTYGYDKARLEERVQWVYDHEELILDSAKDPLGGEKFWTEADEPWQFLAFCFEWKGLMEKGSKFKSRLNVAVDGTCNGLQHLSALLRDEVGGAAVNLKDLPDRQDIYNIVAEKVAKLVHQDAQAGDEYAKLWDGRIDRKLVKRNVMTVPYGATKNGMTGQIMEVVKENKDGAYTHIKELSKPYKACSYLSNRVYEAISETVIAAVKVMDWMKACVDVFNQANQGVIWTTPIGNTVELCKLETKAKRVKTVIGQQLIYLSMTETEPKLNKIKQKNGIAPNIVHSLDASHLALTVNKCVQKGVEAFGMVHDSFGTHARDMSTLYHTLRDEFVKMYTQTNILEDLREQFKVQLPDEYKDMLPEIPEYGNLDINEVRRSAFFFA